MDSSNNISSNNINKRPEMIGFSGGTTTSSLQNEQLSCLMTPITPTSSVPYPRTSTPMPKDPVRAPRKRTVTFNLRKSNSSASLSKHIHNMTIVHESDEQPLK